MSATAYSIYSWMGLHNDDLHNLDSSPNIISELIKKDEMGGAYSAHESYEKCIQNISQKS
jgi:hypothetical protein